MMTCEMHMGSAHQPLAKLPVIDARVACLRVRGAVKGIDQRRVAPTLKPRDRRLVTKNWKHMAVQRTEEEGR